MQYDAPLQFSSCDRPGLKFIEYVHLIYKLTVIIGYLPDVTQLFK